MDQFVIIFNQLEGIDLVLRALRKSSCIASNDLANGIEGNIHVLNERGLSPIKIVELDKEPKKVGNFEVILGGKR